MTVPYVSGTVSVTAGSAVVTGVGTGWATALLTGGMFGLDSANGNPVPIASIDSDTQLTLATPWRGTTAATQAYWIMRDTAYGQQTVANAAALAQIINELRSAPLAALAGLTPAADTVPYFTSSGAAALTDIKAKGLDILAAADAAAAYAALGVIPDAQLPGRLKATGLAIADLNTATETGFYISDLNAANAPLTGTRFMITHHRFSPNISIQIAFGWTNSARGFYRLLSGGSWSAWQLTTLTVLGSVSQSSGVPTGAIIERGSNASGEYVRFADGTQICTRLFATGTRTIASNAYDTINGGGAVAYAATFAAVPMISLGYEGSWSPHALIMFSGGTVSGVSNLFLKNTDTAASRQFNGNFQIVAVGRWF